MHQFVDETIIETSSGAGGDGAVSFRREKYVPKGGPDGGDGGRGGDVIFFVRRNLKTLAELKQKRVYRAQNGEPGRGKKKHGKDGDPVEIPVPPGTLIKDPETGHVFKDLTREGERWVFLQGGEGGAGNSHFATSRRQTPRFAIPGKEGSTAKIIVELNLIADVGFVGLPNAGKSSLLSVLTNAHPKVASFPFTTKIPNLGVLRLEERDIILADIPGILEGASKGTGLGLAFLKHIMRTKVLAFIVDVGQSPFVDSLPILTHELESYLPELVNKKRVIVGTKMDLPDGKRNFKMLSDVYPDDRSVAVSSFTKYGLDELKKHLFQMVESN